MDYDQRHGYRGPEGSVEMPEATENLEESLDDALQDMEEFNGLLPAVVLEASQQRVRVYHKAGEFITISGDGLRVVQRYLNDSSDPKRRIKRGALIRVAKNENGGHWQIVQLPQVEAAVVSLNPTDGAIRAIARIE